MKSSNTMSISSLQAQTTPPATTTATPTATTSQTQTSPGVGPVATGSTIDCPGANGTEFTAPGTNKTFLQICGVEFSGPGEAIDIGHTITNTMQECMVNCAAFPNCTGCSWGYLPGDVGNEHECWMKTSLIEGHTTSDQWCFAILESS